MPRSSEPAHMQYSLLWTFLSPFTWLLFVIQVPVSHGLRKPSILYRFVVPIMIVMIQSWMELFNDILSC